MVEIRIRYVWACGGGFLRLDFRQRWFFSWYVILADIGVTISIGCVQYTAIWPTRTVRLLRFETSSLAYIQAPIAQRGDLRPQVAASGERGSPMVTYGQVPRGPVLAPSALPVRELWLVGFHDYVIKD